jgi:hypothetical protein
MLLYRWLAGGDRKGEEMLLLLLLLLPLLLLQPVEVKISSMKEM